MSVIVENLTKRYGKQNAVDNISFEVKSGEIVGFLGPNGAGKSTTMKIATGYLSATSGKVSVCDYDVQKNPMAVRQHIGYLPEHNPLYLDMYVQEYLNFIGEVHKLKGSFRKKRVAEMIELVGLEREQHKKIGSLSKGYRQRVGLAQALIHNPPVLILDEPTTGLDPNQIVEIRNVIKAIGQEKTVIFSTHILQEVQAICDKAIIINLGKIVANEEIAHLKNLTQNATTILVEFDKPIDTKVLESLETISQINLISNNQYTIQTNSKQDIRADISKLALQNGWIILGLQVQENSLESIFQNLTK